MVIFRSRKRKRPSNQSKQNYPSSQSNQENQGSQERQNDDGSQSKYPQGSQEDLPLSVNLNIIIAENFAALQNIFANCTDFAYCELTIGKEQTPAMLLYIIGLADQQTINEDIIKSLLNIQYSNLEPNDHYKIEKLQRLFLESGNASVISTYGDVADAILLGNIVLMVEGYNQALKIGTTGLQGRQVAEPVTEGVVRGPREGFTESIRINTGLLRRKIKTPYLKLEKFVLGRTTKTEVNVAFLEGIVNPEVVTEVKKRISAIDVDSILESAYIEELIEDQSFTLFPQIDHSEKPDKVAGGILQGQVAIFTDGTPFVMLVPTMMFQFLQSSEDYYTRSIFGTAMRLVRFFFLNLALLLPALYIAITTFHRELLPTPLLTSIISAREGAPFPTVIEVIFMETTFEALREAGIRLPKPVGQAVSIVGGLVIGEAAVQANMVSPITVIVVALTGISSFCIPSYSFGLSIRILRFGMIFLSAVLGIYGMLLGLLMMQAHLISLRSFGVPFFAPVAPFNFKDMKDWVLRVPWWAMGERPLLTSQMDDRRRQKFFLKPDPPNQKQQ